MRSFVQPRVVAFWLCSLLFLVPNEFTMRNRKSKQKSTSPTSQKNKKSIRAKVSVKALGKAGFAKKWRTLCIPPSNYPKNKVFGFIRRLWERGVQNGLSARW